MTDGWRRRVGRAASRVGESFISASNEEYLGVSEYLKNEWGYSGLPDNASQRLASYP